jgi:rhamnogalacturonan endolyase
MHENITVTARHIEKLGPLVWTILRTGTHFAWEIGFPNRDSAEFFHGNDFFTPYLYKTFAKTFPNPLVYDTAKSDPRKDWNYTQSMYITPDGHAEPWKWTVRFNLASVPKSGDCALVLALAGSNRAGLRISLNGKTLDEFQPKLDGGNALLRQSSYAKYSNYSIPVPLARLHAGDNTFDFELTGRLSEASAIFYDYLALEIP